MYAQSLYLLFRTPPGARRTRFIYIVVGAIMMVLSTIAFVCDIVFGDFTWIEHRDFPGGPYAYLINVNSAQIWDTACVMVTNSLGDGLLVWRFCWHERSIPNSVLELTITFL